MRLGWWALALELAAPLMGTAGWARRQGLRSQQRRGCEQVQTCPGHLHPGLPPNHLSPSCLLGSGEQGPFQAPDGSSGPNARKNTEPTALAVTPASSRWLSIR